MGDQQNQPNKRIFPRRVAALDAERCAPCLPLLRLKQRKPKVQAKKRENKMKCVKRVENSALTARPIPRVPNSAAWRAHPAIYLILGHGNTTTWH